MKGARDPRVPEDALLLERLLARQRREIMHAIDERARRSPRRRVSIAALAASVALVVLLAGDALRRGPEQGVRPSLFADALPLESTVLLDALPPLAAGPPGEGFVARADGLDAPLPPLGAPQSPAGGEALLDEPFPLPPLGASTDVQG